MTTQAASHEAHRNIFKFIPVAMGSLLVAALYMMLTLSAAAQTLQEQLEEIEKVLPGNSYTKLSPALAVQSWELAATVAHIQKPASCKTAKLIDTKVTKVVENVIFTSKRRLKQGRWSEVWTFDKCGKKVRVRGDFQADGRGTADGEFHLAQ
ncbi:hypothetical protein SAMN05444414_1462 [Roseovarius marisflavi]|uniref:Uncharacterized protein n=1 Tax=Roseovarius marisflavi TaxID=1054996 RepID=A0A1M7DPB2_9RHOB|nr:hypothetical protein [Roseovarius marisflavi]SHL81312.1 hypothetical protein SAMN05444414_1462 [Roseovarius marisflavi]